MAILKLESVPTDAKAAAIRLGGNFHVLATRPVQAGEVIMRIEGELTRRPDRHTLQVGPDLHLEVPPEASLELILDRYFWRFLNHSCRPSAFIRDREVVALRRLRPWDEVSFDYDCTEWDMAEPFPCRCGSRRCRGLIRGFVHLDRAHRRRLRPWVAPWMLDLGEAGGSPDSVRTTA
ncbi:MAG: SET domain-containing protein-lysine N-methyltransferase [Acidobacteria bacterium]|nr:SET domain-containing protein-lysine N-methyltransferase [Acidobacteriota bacterium]